MEIDLELYKIFYTVALYKNITKASQSLYISQPAVTMSIKKLEDELGTTLFIRTRRGVILTNEGKVLYEYISKAIENINIGKNKIENLKKLETGSIRIGIGTTLTKHFLMEYLEKFHKLYPNISINVDTSMTHEILKELENGKIDLAIVISDSDKCKSANVEYYEDIQDIFVASKEFKEKINGEIDFKELNNYPLLLQNINTSTRQFLDKIALEKGVKLNSIMDLASYSLVIEFAKIGIGIGFVSKKFVKKELKEKELYEIKVNPSIPSRKILVLTKKDYLPSFSTSKLIDIITGKYDIS